jgi:ribosomal protein L22
LQLLRVIPRKSACSVEKTLWSAITNAGCKGALSELLTLKEPAAEKATVLKRFIAKSTGSAHAIRKRTSQIRTVLTNHLGPIM